MLCIFFKHNNGPISATFPIGFVNPDGSEKYVAAALNFIIDWFDSQKYEPMIYLYDERSEKKLTTTFPDKFILYKIYKYEDFRRITWMLKL